MHPSLGDHVPTLPIPTEQECHCTAQGSLGGTAGSETNKRILVLVDYSVLG